MNIVTTQITYYQFQENKRTNTSFQRLALLLRQWTEFGKAVQM